MNKGNVVEFVRTMLTGRELPDVVMENVPAYVRRAVVKLQRRGLLPPLTLEFLAGQVRQKAYKPDGTEYYSYILLPKDFREIDRWKVLESELEYEWVDNEAYLIKRFAKDGQPRYTIRELQNEIGADEFRLILAPFPADTNNISISYYIDGTDTSIKKIPETYWEAILQTIETDLGLKDAMITDGEINDTVYQHKNRKGKRVRIKTTGTFFGKTRTDSNRFR